MTLPPPDPRLVGTEYHGPEDPLRPARGIVHGLILGCLFWLAAAAIVALFALGRLP